MRAGRGNPGSHSPAARAASPAPANSPAAAPPAERWARDRGAGGSMLDFAIFAVTFLLALVGAVLYLYPVTAASGPGVRLRRPRGSGLLARGERSRGSHVAPPRHACPCACAPRSPGLGVLWGLGYSRAALLLSSEAALNYLGGF